MEYTFSMSDPTELNVFHADVKPLSREPLKVMSLSRHSISKNADAIRKGRMKIKDKREQIKADMRMEMQELRRLSIRQRRLEASHAKQIAVAQTTDQLRIAKNKRFNDDDFEQTNDQEETAEIVD